MLFFILHPFGNDAQVQDDPEIEGYNVDDMVQKFVEACEKQASDNDCRAELQQEAHNV